MSGGLRSILSYGVGFQHTADEPTAMPKKLPQQSAHEDRDKLMLSQI